MDITIAFHFAKLIIGGIVCFLAIIIMSKTRDPEWMFIISACLAQYTFEVILLLVQFGLVPFDDDTISFLQFCVPSILLIIAFLFKILKKRG